MNMFLDIYNTAVFIEIFVDYKFIEQQNIYVRKCPYILSGIVTAGIMIQICI